MLMPPSARHQHRAAAQEPCANVANMDKDRVDVWEKRVDV
jgi:hypothetical protein